MFKFEFDEMLPESFSVRQKKKERKEKDQSGAAGFHNSLDKKWHSLSFLISVIPFSHLTVFVWVLTSCLKKKKKKKRERTKRKRKKSSVAFSRHLSDKGSKVEVTGMF